MNQEKYVIAVLKKLKCSGSKKKEIRKELESDIAAALENGESLEEIMARMGSPASLAGEFNDNFSKEEITAFKKAERAWDCRRYHRHIGCPPPFGLLYDSQKLPYGQKRPLYRGGSNRANQNGYFLL